MRELARLYPHLDLGHVRELAEVVAVQRNGVREVNSVYRRARWGVGCLSYDAPRMHLQEVARNGTHPWLAYIPENGTGYAMRVDGAPLRIQRDEPEIRDVLPGERQAIEEQLLLMPGAADPGTILRLEITQSGGEPVEAITLYLFEEKTGAKLDSEIVYRRPTATTAAIPQPPPTGNDPAGATVLPFTRRAQDTDPTKRFTFNDPDAAKGGDGNDEDR